MLAFACKKEELKTKADILCDPTWILEEYSKTANGNKTVFYKKGTSNNQFDFSKDTRNYIKDGTSTSISTANGLGYRGTWKLLNNKTQLQQQQTFPTSGTARTVDISSLTEKELVYTEKSGEETYFSRYIPQQ